MQRALRGGILLELMLSLALFVAGASVIIGVMRGSMDGVMRASMHARADDLACSRLVELDAGLVSTDELRGTSAAVDGEEFAVTLLVEPTGVGDLVRAVATVRLATSVDGPIIIERERLVRLRKDDAE